MPLVANKEISIHQFQSWHSLPLIWEYFMRMEMLSYLQIQACPWSSLNADACTEKQRGSAVIGKGIMTSTPLSFREIPKTVLVLQDIIWRRHLISNCFWKMFQYLEEQPFYCWGPISFEIHLQKIALQKRSPIQDIVQYLQWSAWSMLFIQGSNTNQYN